MSEKFNATQRHSVPKQCGWCKKIRLDSAWVPDRRKVREGRYSRGICPDCWEEYSPAPASPDNGASN